MHWFRTDFASRMCIPPTSLSFWHWNEQLDVCTYNCQAGGGWSQVVSCPCRVYFHRDLPRRLIQRIWLHPDLHVRQYNTYDATLTCRSGNTNIDGETLFRSPSNEVYSTAIVADVCRSSLHDSQSLWFGYVCTLFTNSSVSDSLVTPTLYALSHTITFTWHSLDKIVQIWFYFRWDLFYFMWFICSNEKI